MVMVLEQSRQTTTTIWIKICLLPLLVKTSLFRNRGDGTFEDATEFVGVAGKEQLSAGACFLDIDKDGWLDLFVASYVDFNYRNHVPFPSKGQFLMAGTAVLSLPSGFTLSQPWRWDL